MTGRLAIIPARGGSKRLARKNLLPFCGWPMLAHTVEAALTSGCFERVLVSTEDKEIAGVARTAGAEVFKRSPELADDTATVTDVCLDVLSNEERAGRVYDVFACLYATAPLRRAEDIAAVLALLDSNSTNFAMAVVRWALPPHQALRMGADGMLTPMWPELVELRASEVGPLVVDNGSTYAARIDAFRKEKTFYGTGLRGHVMPRERSVDIDTREDYELACWYAEQISGIRHQASRNRDRASDSDDLPET
jgi:N-acylneuraminate cytidylyltransferase